MTIDISANEYPSMPSSFAEGRAKEYAMLAVRQLLSPDGCAFLAYQPGNGCRYELCLTRLYVSPARLAENPRLTKQGTSLGMSQDGSYVVLSWFGVGSYPFSCLTPYANAHPSYVSRKMGCNPGHGEALALLLNTMSKLLEDYNFYIRKDDPYRVVSAFSKGLGRASETGSLALASDGYVRVEP